MSAGRGQPGALTRTSSLLAVPTRAAGRTIGALAFGFRAAGPVSAEIVLVAETPTELAVTDGQLIGDDIVVACLHLRGERAGMLPA